MSLFGPNLAAPNLGLGGLPEVSTAFDDFINDASRTGNVIVEIQAYPKSAVALSYPPMTNLGWPNLGLKRNPGEEAVQPIQLQYQSHDVTFGPTDSMSPNYHAEARLAERINLSKYFGVRPDTSDAGQVQVNSGIKIRDQDRAVSNILENYNIDGRRVRILFGPKGSPSQRSLYRTVVTTFGEDWTRDSRGDVLVRLQDLQFKLLKQFQTREFGGTGGIEGDSTLAGTLKPRLFGQRFHFEPILIDAANEIYMINDGPIEGSVTLYYGGDAATTFGDFSTYNDLASAGIPEGGFATAYNLGIVRSRRAGGITAPVTVTALGDNVGGFSALFGDMIERIFTNVAGISGSEYDIGTIPFLNIGDGSYWFDGSTRKTIKDVITQLAFEAGGRIVADDKIRALALVDPASSTATEFIKSSEVLREPVREGRAGKSVREFVIRWKPNDRVLTDAEIILPAVDPEFKESLKLPYSTTVASTDATGRHLDYEDQVIVETSALSASTVGSIVSRLTSFWRTERYIWTFLLPKRALFFQMGSVINITYPNAAFENGRNALIIDISDLNFETQTAEIKVLV